MTILNTSSLDVACYITVIPKDVTQFSLYHLGQGRFGNILFEYASVMGIANHSNRKALFGPRMTRLQHVFPNLKMNILIKTTTIMESSCGQYHLRLSKDIFQFT